MMFETRVRGMTRGPEGARGKRRRKWHFSSNVRFIGKQEQDGQEI
jgi:hypothetical protein